MTYQTNETVIARLTKAPWADNPNAGKFFGFARPLDGSAEIYVAPEAMAKSGLTRADIGARVILTMQATTNGQPPFAARMERDDSEIDGIEPGEIELAMLARLSSIERKLAMLLHLIGDDDAKLKEMLK